MTGKISTLALSLGAAAVLGAAPLAAQTALTGAGATFPNPIYSKWFSEYNKLHPNVQINYQPQGSGAGIRQLTARTVALQGGAYGEHQFLNVTMDGTTRPVSGVPRSG